MSKMVVDKEQLPNGIGTPGANRPRRCGAALPARSSRLEPAPAGASRRVDAEAVAGSPAAADQVCEQVFDLLVRQEPLTVSIGRIDGEEDAERLFTVVCGVLARSLREAGASPAQLEIVVDGNSISPQRAAELRRKIVGPGIVHVLASGATPPEPRRREGFWQQLWASRTNGGLRVAYRSRVMTPCPLLAEELADTVLPGTHIQVPAGSAWLQLRVNVERLPRYRGEPCEESLQQALRDCVESGEMLHDEVRWPTAQMHADAWLNRRLAISIDGLGDLVVRQARDPAAFPTLEYLGRLLGRIKDILWEQSRAIALRSAHVPAIERTDPRRMLPNGAWRDDWHRRWVDAVGAAAIRHRNLLVMSPWSVFPTGRPAEFRFADLLPVLRFADVCTLADAPDVRHWTVNTFTAFHLRACAVLHQRESTHQIAERC